MKNKKYISSRLINMQGTMPHLSVDLSIPQAQQEIFVALVPIKDPINDYTFLVLAFESLSGGVSIFPLGMISIPEHPLYISEVFCAMRKPAVWKGAARLLDYKIAITYLEHHRQFGTSLKALRNINKVAESIYQTYCVHTATMNYAGRKVLAWS